MAGGAWKMRSPHVRAAGMPGAPLGCEMSTVALHASENGHLASGTAFSGATMWVLVCWGFFQCFAKAAGRDQIPSPQRLVL